MSEPESGRIFFSGASRSLIEEDEIRLKTVGVDIGSATSHLLFSTIVLERLDSRYVVADRIVEHESQILITPYGGENEIDAARLGTFIDRQYAAAGIEPDEIDTGALILTGVAVRRRNARAIGELFSAQAGKFVAVSAGDGLETLMAAHGSGALALSIRHQTPVMNIDVGGGTTKIAMCSNGEIAALTVVEAGARLVVFGEDDRIAAIEPTGDAYLKSLGMALEPGDAMSVAQRERLAEAMADNVVAAASGEAVEAFLRLPAMNDPTRPGQLVFSGGVSEFIYGREPGNFNDLGPMFGRALRSQFEAWRAPIVPPIQGIRATVVGASQYTVQVSGSTVFLDPPEVLPLRNIPVVSPQIDLTGEDLDAKAIAAAVTAALARLDLDDGEQPVAAAIPWQGSASFARLQALSKGMLAGLAPVLEKDHPLILVFDGDVGGLVGMHCRQEERIGNAIVSIDGIELKELDYIDIGEVLRATGSVPVVVKSLVFPTG